MCRPFLRVTQFRYASQATEAIKVRAYEFSGKGARYGTPKNTKVIEKLAVFAQTGEIRRTLGFCQAKKADSERKVRAMSQQKVLLNLQAKYGSVPLITPDGGKIPLDRLTPRDLRMTNPTLAKIFLALMEVRRMDNKRPSNSLLMTLMGVTPMLVADPYLVTRDVLRLLELDNNALRAMELCRMAGEKGAVGMNAVLEWALRREDVKLAQKTISNRSKWGIPTTDHTHVIHFSGLADVYEWGAVPHETAKKVYDAVAEGKVPAKVDIFNAALKLLTKDYTDDQKLAWSFFDEYMKRKVKHDTFTYTIFLNGCKRMYLDRAAQLAQKSTMSATQRTFKLYENHAKIVQIAETVLLKLLEEATPPIPPTKEEASENPALMHFYRVSVDKWNVEMDQIFLLTILPCFLDGSFGSGATPKDSVHYEYAQRALLYLQAWVPETRELLKFASEGPSADGDSPIVGTQNTSVLGGNMPNWDYTYTVEPSKILKVRTDGRAAKANLRPEITPAQVLQPLSNDDLNPNVLYPPSPMSSQKSQATFSGIKRALVNFARPSFSSLRKEYLRQLFRTTNGAQGIEYPPQRYLEHKNHINSFLLRHFVDALLKLDRKKEFHYVVWYSLAKWGKIKFDVTKVRSDKFEPFKYSKFYVSAPQTQEYYGFSSADLPKPSIKCEKELKEGKPQICEIETAPPRLCADLDVVDTALVEDFIYKIEENFPLHLAPSRFSAEVLAALCYGATTLRPRLKTADAVVSTLFREIYRFNDYNYSTSTAKNAKREIADNTPRHSITFVQLTEMVEAITTLVKCISICTVMEANEVKLVNSLDNIMQRIYDYTWTDALETNGKKYYIHEQLLTAAILFWQPRQFSELNEPAINNLWNSVLYVMSHLEGRDNLNTRDKVLLLALKDICNINPKSEGAFAKLKRLQWRIFRLGENTGEENRKIKADPWFDIHPKLRLKDWHLSDVDLEKKKRKLRICNKHDKKQLKRLQRRVRIESRAQRKKEKKEQIKAENRERRKQYGEKKTLGRAKLTEYHHKRRAMEKFGEDKK